MSSYALHLANLAEAKGVDLSKLGIKHVMCSAEPVSQAKRDKIERSWGAKLTDNFGMTEAGMMGSEWKEDEAQLGFRVWTDFHYIEVLDPKSLEPAKEGEVGTLVVTALRTNNVTPFLRWSSGDLVTYSEAEKGSGPFSVFPRIKHAHRTAGFFKIRGINLGLERGRQRLPQAVDRSAPRLRRLSDLRGDDFAAEAEVRADPSGRRPRDRHPRQGVRGERQGRALPRPALSSASASSAVRMSPNCWITFSRVARCSSSESAAVQSEISATL
jgi:hypothetical protein